MCISWLLGEGELYPSWESLTGRWVSGRSGRPRAEGMMRLVGRGCRRTVGPYSAAGCASRATPVDNRVTTYDGLIQATSELDPGQVAAMSVHGVVVTRRQ